MTCAPIRLERALFALAGTMTLASVALAVSVSTWFLALTGLVALSQWLFVIAGWCPASLVLSRAPCIRDDGAR